MKASELRLGNLIYNKQGDIVYVNTNHLTLLSYGIEDEFKPIPLTEEWLLKFGFDFYPNIGARKFMNLGNLIIEINAHGDIPAYYTVQKELICFIKYVHQLQNLYFALAGEELKPLNQ